MDSSVMKTMAEVFGGIPHFVLAVLLVYAGKLFYDITTPYKIDEELTKRDNPAFGVCFAGFIIGLSVAVAGAIFGCGAAPVRPVPPADLAAAGPVLTGGAASFWSDMLTIFVGGVCAILLMRLSIVVNDKLILYRFSIDKEMIQDRNAGTGAVVAGSCIATGLVLNGALTGDSNSLLGGIRDIVVYWAVGQFLLVLGGVVFQAITSYDVHKVIGEQDNLPAGISFGGFLTAMGIVVRAAVSHSGGSSLGEIWRILFTGIVGLVLLACSRVIADRVFLPASPLSKEVVIDRNAAAGFVAAATFVGVAVVLAMALTL